MYSFSMIWMRKILMKTTEATKWITDRPSHVLRLDAGTRPG
jgi:hypothetical protein